jgi:hypothetical protein
MKILEVRPRWNHGYANLPDIDCVVDEVINWHDLIWIPVPDETAREKTMMISQSHAPWVSFVYIDDPHGSPTMHGALGGNYKMPDGSIFHSRSGWSSRCGVLNTKYCEFLEDEIVDVTVRSVHGGAMLGGFSIYLSHITPLVNDLGLFMVMYKPSYAVDERSWHISIDPHEVKKPPRDDDAV